MTLKDAIQRVPGWETMTPTELLAALTEVTHTPKPVEDRKWSVAGISREFSATVGQTVYQAIITAGLTGIAAQFASTGIDATNAQWLAVSDQLIASGVLNSIGSEDQQKLKWIGHTSEQLWSDPVTLAQIVSATMELNTARQFTRTMELFIERMTVDGDATAVWAQAWSESEAN